MAEASMRGAYAARDETIRFEGSYDHEPSREVLAPLDAVVIPSVWYEKTPTSGLNAVAAGVPVIGSDLGGIQELVRDDGSGLTLPVGDAVALAALLDELLDDPARLRQIRDVDSAVSAARTEGHRMRHPRVPVI